MKWYAWVLVVAACASPGMPPGGPEDHDPPIVVAVSPESGSVNPRVREVVFRFNEVVSETPRTGTDLRSAVLISPRDGEPDVSWNHDAISVKPRRGWRDSTTYVVTLLAGIVDLEGNARDSATVTVFSTGGSIPPTKIAGVAFDWVRNIPAPRAFIEAFPAADTTVRYATETDTVGRFVLPFMRPGTYMVRALIDADRNKTVGARESWDTVSVVLRDTTGIEMYLYPHDSAGPAINTVTIVDSLTLRVVLDKPVTAQANYTPTVQLVRRDSTPVPIRRFVPWPIVSSERDARAKFVRDSTADADTNSTRRAARAQARTDSINRAAIRADSLARLPNQVVAPKPQRPPLVTEYAIELSSPLTPGSEYRVLMTAVGMSGAERESVRSFTVPRTAAADSTSGRGRGGRPQR